ncbi:MAG: hypothetical protein J2P53_10000 [Bradyrhizobiaceae bacterium]|nr:hypothetical protein [Bradyrhizobiaceae bacterium]
MDLTTLITACALTVDPKIMHALVWHQSGGEPWSFTVPGQHQPHVHRTIGDAVDAARSTLPDDVAIRIGLAGVPAKPGAVTAAMFAPCANVASAARQIARFADVCRTSSATGRDPIHCAIAAWHGAWERPDNGFADAVRASVAGNDAPDFVMPAEPGSETTDSSSARRRAPDDAAPGTTQDDRERARMSPLFPVTSGKPDHASSASPAGDRPRAAGQGIAAPDLGLTAAPPVQRLFVPRSMQRFPPGPE